MKTSSNNLFILGLIGIAVGFLVLISGSLYGYSFFVSISESATTPLTTSMILPFCLGAMSIFFFGYKGYDMLDVLLTKSMAVGALVVAMCPCKSEFITSEKIGLFCLSVNTSNILHHIGAVMLFGAFIFWVGIQFRKGKTFIDIDRKPKQYFTKQKKVRNEFYFWCALTSLAGVAMVALGAFDLTYITNYIWLGEVMMLMPLSVAVIIKSGIILKDKKNETKKI